MNSLESSIKTFHAKIISKLVLKRKFNSNVRDFRCAFIIRGFCVTAVTLTFGIIVISAPCWLCYISKKKNYRKIIK